MGGQAQKKPTVWAMVRQAVDALGGSTTNAAVRDWVWDKYPGTNRSTIHCQLVAGCVNHPSRVHYAVDARPRPANDPEVDLYFRPSKGRLERYDPYRLPYAYEVTSYKDDQPEGRRAARYQTDLLVYDEVGGGEHWVPRVVVECKVKGVTTHDALTYSGKAATHKQVHPYLRYGMLVGRYGAAVPARLVRHGAFFDFMAVWEDADAGKAEWEDLLDVLTQEVRASRQLQELLAGARRKPFRLLHRPLVLKGS